MARVNPSGSAELNAQSRDGTVRAALGVKPDGRPYLDLRDEHGKVRTVYALNLDGLPQLEMLDREERHTPCCRCGPMTWPGLSC